MERQTYPRLHLPLSLSLPKALLLDGQPSLSLIHRARAVLGAGGCGRLEGGPEVLTRGPRPEPSCERPFGAGCEESDADVACSAGLGQLCNARLVCAAVIFV